MTVRKRRAQCGCGCGGRPKTRRARFLPGHDVPAAYADQARLERRLEIARICWARPGADLRAAYAARRMLAAL